MTRKIKTERYSPTQVSRVLFDEDGRSRVTETYLDGTVRDIGINHHLGGALAQMRVYIDDPTHEDPYGERHWDKVRGFWVDADSDIDLERFEMVISTVTHMGHGTEVWRGFVEYPEDSGLYRQEEWVVAIHAED